MFGFYFPPPRKWTMMPAFMTDCCGPSTSAALTTWSSSWHQLRVRSSGVCTFWKLSRSCSETRLVRRTLKAAFKFGPAALLDCYVEALQLSAQTPDALVSAGQSRSAEEKLRDSQELESLRQKEHAAKRSRTFQRGTR